MEALYLYKVDKDTIEAVLVTRALNTCKGTQNNGVRLKIHEQQQNHVFILLLSLLAKLTHFHSSGMKLVYMANSHALVETHLM